MSEKKVGVRKIRSGAETVPTQPSLGNDAIAARADPLFVERGCEHGRELDDWLAAERELALASAGPVVTARRATDRRRAPKSQDN